MKLKKTTMKKIKANFPKVAMLLLLIIKIW